MSKENSVNTSITENIESENTGVDNSASSFPAAMQEIGEMCFERYPDKTSSISNENKIGLIRIRALNKFMQENYGVRYSVLDEIDEGVMNLSMSVNALGLNTIIAALHNVNASFEQHAIPDNLKGLMKR